MGLRLHQVRNKRAQVSTGLAHPRLTRVLAYAHSAHIAEYLSMLVRGSLHCNLKMHLHLCRLPVHDTRCSYLSKSPVLTNCTLLHCQVRRLISAASVYIHFVSQHMKSFGRVVCTGIIRSTVLFRSITARAALSYSQIELFTAWVHRGQDIGVGLLLKSRVAFVADRDTSGDVHPEGGITWRCGHHYSPTVHRYCTLEAS